MNTTPPNNDGEIQESVQDYLDLLLTQATEKPEAQISLLPEREEWPATQPATVTSLSMVGGGNRQSIPAAEVLSRRTEPRSMPVRPFAEPVKPLPLRFAPRPVVSEEQTPKTPPKQTVVAAKPQVELQQEIQPSQPVVEAEPVDTKQVDSTPAGSTSIDTQEQALQLQAEETAAAVFQTTQWLNGRPSWAQARFECLLFNVGGLTLAVPLVELGAIHPIRNEITPLFGQADWFMGLLTVKNSNIKTVNTPKLVMPERYNERMKEQFNYVISINGVEWGLAVDNVSTAIVLKPEDVRWRTERGKRPWLAGTVIEHMCALLDISQLAAMFVASSRQLQR